MIRNQVKKNTKLTVAIPTYNREIFLHECLKSLDKQTYKDFEIIIFDNASSYEIELVRESFPNLKISIDRNHVNIGNRANFEKIFSFDFKSEYVIIFHDDDTLHPFYFEQAIAYIKANPTLKWVGSNIRFVKGSDKEMMGSFDSKKPKDSFKVFDLSGLLRKLIKGFNLGFGSVIYKSNELKRIKFRSEEFGKWFDRPLLIDIACSGKVGLTDFKFMNYRVHNDQDSQEKATDRIKLTNLMRYFGSKIDNRDYKLFKTWEANNLINSASRETTSPKVFFTILKYYKRHNIFDFRYIGIKGAYYFFMFIFNILVFKIKKK